MNIKQFRYSADNLGYMVHGTQTAVVIDGGAVDEMLDYADREGLSITCVTNTHSHYDHISGNREMLERTGALFLDCSAAEQQGAIDVDGEPMAVFSTPGHMDDCITFSTGSSLITGDTLFNGTVGNCFSGDLKRFFESIRFLLSFPGETQIYAGHDYVRDSLAFSRTLEPGNRDIDVFMEAYDPGHVVSTLAWELKINPFVRFDDDAMIRVLRERDMPSETSYDRWQSMMERF